MHFTIERDALFQELLAARKYTTKVIPALSNFLVEADDKMQRVTVSSSDSQNHFIVHVPAQVKKPGAHIMNSVILMGGVKNMDSGKSLVFKEDGNTVIMSCDKTKLKIPLMPAQGFVNIPHFHEDAVMEMTTDELKTIVNTTTFARITKPASQTDFKFEGINLKITGGTGLFACTDRERITIARHTFNVPIDANFILAAKPLEDFASSLPAGEKVYILINTQAERICFESCDKMLFLATYSEKFPDVTRLIPSPIASVTVPRLGLIEKLEIAGLVDDEVDLKAKGKNLYFESRAHGEGEYTDALPATVSTSMDIRLKTPKLLEGLKKMECDDVELRLTASDKPAIIRPKGNSEYAYMLMPIS